VLDAITVSHEDFGIASLDDVHLAERIAFRHDGGAGREASTLESFEQSVNIRCPQSLEDGSVAQ
jgi:hypothetical protein